MTDDAIAKLYVKEREMVKNYVTYCRAKQKRPPLNFLTVSGLFRLPVFTKPEVLNKRTGSLGIVEGASNKSQGDSQGERG